MYDGGGRFTIFGSGGLVVLGRLRFVVVAMLMVGFLAACSDGNEGQDNEDVAQAISVELASVVKEDVLVSRAVFGRVGLMAEEAVMLSGPGELTEVHVANGDVVSEDDDLITFKSAVGEQKLRAPADGVVAQFTVREGDMLSAEEPLMLIVDMDELEASFQMTRETRDLLAAGDEIDILFGDQAISGIVEPFDVLPNEAGQFDVMVVFDNKDAELAVGDVVKLEVEEKRVKDTLIVPTEALLTADEASYVFVLDESGDRVRRVDVEVIELQSDFVAVKVAGGEGVDDGDVSDAESAGLSEADEVVVRGQFLLEDGSEVSVVKDGNES